MRPLPNIKLDRKIEMFSPPKLKIIVAMLTAMVAMTTVGQAQQAEYNRRIAAMQQARQRAQTPTDIGAEIRVASADIGVDYAAPPAPSNTRHIAQAPRQTQARRTTSRQAPRNQYRVAQAPQRVQQARTRSAQPQQSFTQTSAPPSNRVASKYTPQHLRTAQLYDETYVDGGSPVIGSAGCSSCGGGGCTSCGGGTYETIIDGGICADGGCGSCSGDCGYFDDCDSCCGRGGCPPGPCWLTGFGAILLKGEYGAGATGFQNGHFNQPTGTAGLLAKDCNFGFYESANFGFPLCKLTCGVLSGQLGVRGVQSNFNGNDFSVDQRDQLFLTAGMYRRVDYGLQAGAVIDYLYEEWFTETETVQLRADIGWVWQSGATFGFRYTDGLQDDVSNGTFNGVAFTGINTLTEDNYRFYMRKDGCAGGYGEAYFGWSDSDQTIFGMDADLPVCDSVALQATFTYFLDDAPVPVNSGFQGGNFGDAWNLGVGFVWRPAGRAAYRSYDRPLFNVADNGSMLLKRQ